MPKAIPDGLKKDHVLLALKDLDEGIEHDFGEATGYQLINDGKGYAPKAVVGIAFRHLNGTILGHGEFSGGEQKGQANYVLRELGFSIQPIRPSEANTTFITSRGYSIPEDWAEFQQAFWFNMWQKRMWPYNEVGVGNTLYWYDSQSQRVVWKSEISELDRFEYATKQELRDRLIDRFAEDPATDPYHLHRQSRQGRLKAKRRWRTSFAPPAAPSFPKQPNSPKNAEFALTSGNTSAGRGNSGPHSTIYDSPIGT